MPLADSANSYLTLAVKLHCTGLTTGVSLVREGQGVGTPPKKEARFTDSWPQLRMLAGLLYRPDLDPAGAYRQSRLPGRPGGPPPGTQAVQRSSRQLTASLSLPVSASGSGPGLVDHGDSDVHEWHGDMRAGFLLRLKFEQPGSK